MRIGVLAYENCLAAEIFVFTDLLRIANRVARETGAAPTDPFRVSVIAATADPVPAAGGFPIGVRRWHHRFDRIVVPGFELVPSEDPVPQLTARRRETAFLESAADRGIRIASVCVGAFLLGEAGLLDGRRCTTSWLFAAHLGRRYPRTTVCPEAMAVTDGPITTTAAFSAALDLATALVREHLGDEIARATARITLVAENRTSQAPYIVDSMLPAARALFADDVGAWLVEHLAEPYDLKRLAGAFHVSTRTMLRRFGAETGQAPRDFLRRARVRAARNLLETTDLSVGRIVERVGYRDTGTFRRLFVNQVGVGPAEYRRQFRGETTIKGGDFAPPLQDGCPTD
ncbi:GlxA family transcriptional regulator [Rhodococcus xishaensis]|uniref:Helix-turn-helix domain-containing protein n=1 Tax=Rhodococcus xishaensis TaxID=2487364 RepID=A0A438ARC4_9NOCA|nr:helix-turn-helix domain-containing protein [Rhodococcus xishaensis]RVW01251.1 helix-turn-helix domain-containing protein [Rhodococcus xishaensis]